ncbi:MAG: AtpZ/AtpI family protein [Patescibacteria group bacterium]
MKHDSWDSALRIMANISGWIAFPVIIGLYLGKWLDQKFHTDPWLFLITIAFFFFVSMYGLVSSTLKEAKRWEQKDPDAGQSADLQKNQKK